MVNPLYAIKCLRLGFERYKKYSRLPVSIKVSKTTASFYVKKPSMTKGKDARVSDHHPSLQRYAEKNEEPWLSDNVSIEFIEPDSKEDKKQLRARVRQNAAGTIEPFDVTVYQYNSNLIEPTDIVTIFKAIIVFLNGLGYSDPFEGTQKKAKILPRHSNIKPFRTTTNNNGLNEMKLNEMAYYCLGDYLLLLENNQQTNENTTMNKKQKIRLSESALRRIINEVVANTLEKDLAGNTIYDLGNGYTTSDLDGMIRSLKDKLSYLNDKHARLNSEIMKVESDIQDFEERLAEVEEVFYGGEQ